MGTAEKAQRLGLILQKRKFRGFIRYCGSALEKGSEKTAQRPMPHLAAEHPVVTSTGGDWGLGIADCGGTPYHQVSVVLGGGAKRTLVGAAGPHRSLGSSRRTGPMS